MPSKNPLESSAVVVDSVEDAMPVSAPTTWATEVSMDANDIPMPYMKLAQGLTEEVTSGEAKMGNWLLEGYPPVEDMTVVPVRFGYSRSRTDRANGNFTRLCYAPTVPTVQELHGVGDPGIACSECPFAKWTEGTEIGPDGKTKNTPPACGESWDFLFYSAEFEALVRFGFRGTAIPTGKALASMARARGLGNFAVTLGSKKVSKNGRTYSVPTIHAIIGAAAQEVSEVIEIARVIMG